MNQTADRLSEKMTNLSEHQLAEAERFIESLQLNEDRSLVRAATSLSERSFEKIWNNPEDAVYESV